jgi:MoxR-like ATPase
MASRSPLEPKQVSVREPHPPWTNEAPYLARLRSWHDVAYSGSEGNLAAIQLFSDLQEALSDSGYIADRSIATTLGLAITAARPVLLEGGAGVGKTFAAKALADALKVPLIRLQCYEGIDAAQALYDWDYRRQLLYMRQLESGASDLAAVDSALPALDMFGEALLVERPLLRALREPEGCVLLIDEIDRADDEFEALLLELLSEFAITIPELGTTVTARHAPIVILTSNRTRELHDALRRRCLYHWVEFPNVELETAIIRKQLPELDAALAASVADAVARIRRLGLLKLPGVSETIDWARALAALGARAVTSEAAAVSLGWIAKSHEDLATVRSAMAAESWLNEWPAS